MRVSCEKLGLSSVREKESKSVFIFFLVFILFSVNHSENFLAGVNKKYLMGKMLVLKLRVDNF